MQIDLINKMKINNTYATHNPAATAVQLPPELPPAMCHSSGFELQTFLVGPKIESTVPELNRKKIFQFILIYHNIVLKKYNLPTPWRIRPSLFCQRSPPQRLLIVLQLWRHK